MKPLTQTELSWLREIVANTVIRFTTDELRRYKLYLAKAILQAREATQ